MSPTADYFDEIIVQVLAGQTLLLELTGKPRIGSTPPPAGGGIAGVLKNKDSGSPVSGARVDLFTTQLRLPQALNAFEQATTTSKKLTSLAAGDYPVLDIQMHTPTADTDFVKVRFSDQGGANGWICARSKTKFFAYLYDQRKTEGAATTQADGKFQVAPPGDQMVRLRFVLQDFFDAESERVLPPAETLSVEMTPASKSVLESYLVTRLKDFAGFGYNLNTAYYPYALPNVTIHQAPPKQNNCCTFTEALTVKAWKDALGSDFAWSLALHNKFMILATDYFSPVTAAVESGMGVLVDNDPPPPPWTLVQGWRSSSFTGGHSFLIVEVHPQTQRVLTLESNSAYLLNGPGCRNLGNLDTFPDQRPPMDWWQTEKLQDWNTIKSIYSVRKMARLKVNDLKWVR